MIAKHEFVKLHFKTMMRQNENGRFIVSLLKKRSINCLRGSVSRAMEILLRNKRKLPFGLHKLYADFMTKYKKLERMRKLSNVEISKLSYYLPHHAVIKTIEYNYKMSRCIQRFRR